LPPIIASRRRNRRATPAREFRAMVKALHDAGLEVILDVVYNHTVEGDHLGATLSWRGVDNRGYYRLMPDRPAYYENFTGTGNTVDTRSPLAVRMIMDSLRYWIEEMHVDGFRFDLASALARGDAGFDRSSAFLEVVAQDPVISRVKLIAEPWDATAEGYQVGNFPPGWSEWNGRYRDGVRRFWKGDAGTMGEFASRLAGSHDMYGPSGRQPYATNQLRHRARRLHARRSGVVQRQAQRGQRRREPRRRQQQPELELRRRGTDRQRRGERAAPPPDPQFPADAVRLRGRADDLRRR
jgi:glycogen operon protein